ncbi:MAG: hypothetical protein OK474_04240 [Thaumarchaeota archaeon]|nr:hypothetical protein [Nitrososphaerota archaeon]
MTSETDESGGMKDESAGAAMPAAEMSAEVAQPPEAEAPAQTEPQAGGKRTQLKIVRENIQSLSKDVGDFGKSHEVSIKKLEKQVAALRSELAAQTVSKDVGSFRKSHEAGAKRLEKQVAVLRSELAALKSSIAKDAARSRAKQEATLAKILAKVSAKPKAAKATKSSKPAKGKKKQ